MITLAQRLLWGAEQVGGKRALAAAAGISEAQLYRYLEGESAIPHDKLEALAKALGADPAWLLTGRGPWQMPQNRLRPEFRGQLLQDLDEQLALLLLEYQRHIPPPFKSRLLRYLYEVLRHEEQHNQQPVGLDKFSLLQYISVVGEMKTEAELEVFREAFETIQYQGLQPDYPSHHQLFTTWCNLLIRGKQAAYNSHAGQVYFERMGQALPSEAIAELHKAVEETQRILNQKTLDWLDAGCGNGRHLAHLHKFMPNLRLQGLELSDLGTTLCKKLEQSERLPPGSVSQGDIRLAPYKGESFDVVFARLSLHEIPYLPGLDVGIAAYLAEIHRILRPGALLYWVTLEGNHFDFKNMWQFLQPHELATLAQQQGFQILSQQHQARETYFNQASNQSVRTKTTSNEVVTVTLQKL